jgi:hypothetical protein
MNETRRFFARVFSSRAKGSPLNCEDGQLGDER